MGLSSEEIARVYERRQPGFVLAVAAMLDDRDAARDVVQDGFARALLRRHRCRGAVPEAWIWRIVEREAFGELRRRGRTLSLERDFDARLVPSEENPALAAAVKALPPRRRLVVFLRYFADLPYADIARICDMREGTVAATLAQAHDELQRRLAAMEEVLK
jgi:RNA polymerase sigma factor (sigma-70 family)